jgi:hypothetical protein
MKKLAIPIVVVFGSRHLQFAVRRYVDDCQEELGDLGELS